MSLENRVEMLEANRKPEVDLAVLMLNIERACRRLTPEKAHEKIRAIMRTLPDEALLEIAGLGPMPTNEQLLELAKQGRKADAGADSAG